MENVQKLKKKLKYLWLKIVSFFSPRWKVEVSYNKQWGDTDDKTFIAKKFYQKKEKFLKFKTDSNDKIEIRSATGLNYRIEEL